jgi:hypothetical protein
MKLLAIPLSHQRTVAKWLVISQTRRARLRVAVKTHAGVMSEPKIAAPHMPHMQARFLENNEVWQRNFGF